MDEPQPLGRIEVSSTAIATLASQAVMECYGVVGMAPSGLSAGLAELLQRDHSRRGVEVRFEDGAIIIDLHVIIEYGTRISTVAHNIQSAVKFQVEKTLGVPVAQVNVHVQGLRVSNQV